jgi:hypothetical protein
LKIYQHNTPCKKNEEEKNVFNSVDPEKQFEKLQTIHNIVKLSDWPMCQLTDEWIKKMWSTCTMEFFSGLKKNGMLFVGRYECGLSY